MRWWGFPRARGGDPHQPFLGASACPPPNQELISGHFGEDSASYEAEIRELADLRQVGGPP